MSPSPGIITSRRSPRIRAVRSLFDAKTRRAAGLIVVEGPDPLTAAIEAGVRIEEVLLTRQARSRFAEVVNAAESTGAALVEVSEPVMDALAQTHSPQGIIAVCAWQPARLADAIRPGSSSLVLDAVSDPGNAGTIIRTADAVDLAGLVLVQGCVDPGNAKALRASTGSVFHVPIAVGIQPEQVLARAREAGQALAVVVPDGEVELFAWLRTRPPGHPVCWVLGSEAHGVGDILQSGGEVSIRIPMPGRAESLNVASAAAVCLYAALARGMED